MGVAAAVVGGTALAGIAGAAISANAASSGANAEANAATSAANASEANAQQTAANLAPFLSSGSTAANSLQASLGLGGTGTNLLAANGINSLTFQPTEQQLESTPGYQFDLQQGLESTQNSYAAQGLGVSGAAMKGADNYATGLANNTLSTQQGIFQDNLNNVLSPLESLSSLGENAANQTGELTTSNINSANTAAVGAANAQAAGDTGVANSISGGLNSAGNSPMNYMLYASLLKDLNGYTPSGANTATGGSDGNPLYTPGTAGDLGL